MIFKITVGIYLVLIGLSSLGIYSAPTQLTGVLALIGGTALLAGF